MQDMHTIFKLISKFQDSIRILVLTYDSKKANTWHDIT